MMYLHKPFVFKSARGFTYIELMVTLGIMAVLASVAVPLTQVSAQRYREYELRHALIEIREAIDAYKRAADQGKITLYVGDSGYPKSLKQLVEGVNDQKNPNKKKIYFLRRLPLDPMNPEETDPEKSWGLRSYASPPDDPKEGDDVFDIYSKSSKIGLNGVPYILW